MCKDFCYLGDTLDGDGGAVLAATARISNSKHLYTSSRHHIHALQNS